LPTSGKDINKNTRIGIDASLISAGKDIFSTPTTLTDCALVDAENLKKSLEPRNSELVSFEKNLVDIVWAQERPAPKARFFLWISSILVNHPRTSLVMFARN
jgi:Xaa-Pro aminopeptidase